MHKYMYSHIHINNRQQIFLHPPFLLKTNKTKQTKNQQNICLPSSLPPNKAGDIYETVSSGSIPVLSNTCINLY